MSRGAALGAGAAAAVGLHQAAETAAGLRQAAGSIEAGVDRVQGQVQRQVNATAADALRGVSRLLPGEQPWLDDQARQLDRAGERTYQRNAAEAADAQREAAQDATCLREGAQSLGQGTMNTAARVGGFQHDTLAGAGQRVDRTLDAAGQTLEAVTARTPPAALEPVRPIVDLPAIQVRPEPELQPGISAPAAPAAAPAPEPPRPGQASHAPPGPPVTPDFRNPHHPLHGPYQQALDAVDVLEEAHNIPFTDKSECVAAAITAATQAVPEVPDRPPGTRR